MSSLSGLALAAALLAGVAAAPRTQPADWTEERRTETAARLIDQCLGKAGLNLEARAPCVEIAFHTCLRDNGGRESTYDLNVCRAASLSAWQARYDAVTTRLETVFQSWEREPDDARKPEWRRLI